MPRSTFETTPMKHTLETHPMTDFQFRTVIQKLSPNQGAEMLWYARKRPDILSLAQGEGSLTTPDFITHAALKSAEQGRTFYAPVQGVPELRQEISNYYSRIMNQNIPTNRIFVTGSGTTAMHLALTSILDEGDEVVAVTPIWKNLLGAVELAQAKVVQVGLQHSENRGWTLDLDMLFSAVTHKTKAMLIVTPSNPTGWVMKRDDIKSVMDFARERGIWIIADEVYHRTVFDQTRSPSFLEVAEPEDKLYVINSFSKSYAMTGWRLGWLVGPSAAENVIRDIALYDNMGPPTFTQLGGVEALRNGEDFIESQRQIWAKNLDLVMNRFQKNGRIRMIRPEATFYAFFQVDGEPNCLILTKRLIDEQALSLAPGCAFGKCCSGWIRMCFAASESKMTDALNRLDRALL